MFQLTRNLLITISLLFLGFTSFSTGDKIKIKKYKYGVLLGIEKGKYNFLELGGEFQYKKVKLKDPITLATRFLISYEIKENIVNYTTGIWYRKGRTNLTYGLDLHLISNFDTYKLGFAPDIGYKLLGFHLHAGYKIMSNKSFEEHNTFYVGVRYFLSQKRKTSIKKQK